MRARETGFRDRKRALGCRAGSGHPGSGPLAWALPAPRCLPVCPARKIRCKASLCCHPRRRARAIDALLTPFTKRAVPGQPGTLVTQTTGVKATQEATALTQTSVPCAESCRSACQFAGVGMRVALTHHCHPWPPLPREAPALAETPTLWLLVPPPGMCPLPPAPREVPGQEGPHTATRPVSQQVGVPAAVLAALRCGKGCCHLTTAHAPGHRDWRLTAPHTPATPHAPLPMMPGSWWRL